LKLAPEHLSAYSLIVEDNTPLARMVRAKQVSPNPPDAEADLYELTMATMLENGYEHYEVSNYAREGYRSRHNWNYWQHGNYLGFGPSAHSFWTDKTSAIARRWWNVASVSGYNKRLMQGEFPRVSEESLSVDALMTERLFLGLRSCGLNLREFRKEFGGGLLDKHQSLIEEFVDRSIVIIDGDLLRLTSKGFLVCDEVCVRLLS